MSTTLFALDSTSKKLTPIPAREMAALGLKETSDLETWLASADARLFGRKVLWIARQDRASDEQRSDLIGVDETGDLLVTELKRGPLGEDAITQALCYAADYAQLSAEEVAQRFADNSAKATAAGLIAKAKSLADAQALLSKHVGEDTEVNESQILLLVAEDFSAKALSVCDYLNEGEGKFSVECWRYTVCEGADKKLFLTIEQIVPAPSVRQAIDDKREASKARKRARDPVRIGFMRSLVEYLLANGISAWRNRGQSYECQIESVGKEFWLSIHTHKPRLILPAALELEGDPTAFNLTATTNGDGKEAYEFADVDAGSVTFTAAFGARAIAVINKVRAKSSPGPQNGAEH